MNRLYVPEPLSGGIFLSYRCTCGCKHCLYACSPNWRADWISEDDLEKVLTQLCDKIQPSPLGSERISLNHGLHLTGGEPFLNFDLLLKAAQMLREFEVPSTFVETNCFWCVDGETTKMRLRELRDAGLHGVLISVNPFVLERVPFDRTERAIGIAEEIFERNVLVYQEYLYNLFRRLNLKGTLSFEEYLRRAGPSSLNSMELLPMGRTTYALGYLYRKYPAEHFFGESCEEELTRSWHVHVDNYCNYMAGYCGGISLGDARDLDLIFGGVDLEDKPILNALATDLKKLYDFGVEEFYYKEMRGGYISKCHLCIDIRRHIAQQTDEFRELRPREFYHHLS